MKILFDIDQLPSTSSTCKSKEERFAELEKRVCEIDEKFAKVLARKGCNATPFDRQPDDEMSDEDKTLAGIETENLDEEARCASDIADGVEGNHVNMSEETECSCVAMPKTRGERIAELECKLAAVSEKFDKLATSLGIEVSNTKLDDENSAIAEELTTEPIATVTMEAPADMAEEQFAEPVVAPVVAPNGNELSVESLVEKNSAANRVVARAFANKVSKFMLMGAALVALVFTFFIGVSLVDSGEIRNVDPEIFYYFTEHGFIDYFAAFKGVNYSELVVASGFYPTETLVRAYEIIYTLRALVASLTVIFVALSSVFAIYHFVYALRRKTIFNHIGVFATVLSYLCGVIMLFAIECGNVMLVYSNGKNVLGVFTYSLRLNAMTRIGGLIAIVLLTAGIICKKYSQWTERSLLNNKSTSSEKKSGVERSYSKKKNELSVRARRLLTVGIVAFTILGTFLAGGYAFTVNTEKETKIYQFNFSSGQLTEGEATEISSLSMPLVSFAQKYSLREEEILLEIRSIDVNLASEPDNLDLIIRREECESELETIRELADYSLNLGVTSLVAALCTVLFCGIMLLITLGKLDSVNADAYAVISVLPLTASVFNACVAVFVLSSFGKFGVVLSGTAPFFAFICIACATVCAFFLRPSLVKNTINKEVV